MYSVSLLPSEYRAIHQNVKKKDIRLLIAMGIMSILTVAYLVLTFTMLNLDKEYQALQDENVDLLIEIEQLKGLEQLNYQMESLLAKAVAAKGSVPQWDEILVQIGNSVPETVGLESVDIQQIESIHKCVIEGKATDHTAVSQWLKALEGIEGIEDIKCSFSAVDDQDTGSASKFKISFTLLKGPGYKLPLEVK
jgi:Tfp pilus assembly protein PilN